MKLASIFTDHMVLQANQPVKVFGEGAGTVKISFLGNSVTTTFSEEEWCVTLPAMAYGGPYEMQIELNGNPFLLHDIYIGEVWLACGQSNMEMPLFRTDYGFEEAQGANNDLIRLFTVPKREEKNTPCYGHHFVKMHGFDTPWQLCTEDTALRFSAIGYHVAKELQEQLQVAVGIISCNWGGTLIEGHVKREYFRDHPTLKHLWEDYQQFVDRVDMDAYLEQFSKHLENWKTYYDSITIDEVENARKIGVRAAVGKRYTDLEEPFYSGGPYYRNYLGCLYDAMFARIMPFGVKGILWYQGESNGYEWDYLEKYLLLMQCMRDGFENPDMPFYAVELASFGCWNPNRPYTKDRYATDESWAFLREQQQRATEIAPNNYLVTTMGLGDFIDIHPMQKKPLAHRMTLKILKYTYDFDLAADQPLFESATFENGKAYIKLQHADGLYCNNLDGLSEVDMYLADESHLLKRATIEIANDTLILSSSEVPHPILARYAFDDFYGGCHIYNSSGLPLAPFRTDF